MLSDKTLLLLTTNRLLRRQVQAFQHSAKKEMDRSPKVRYVRLLFLRSWMVQVQFHLMFHLTIKVMCMMVQEMLLVQMEQLLKKSLVNWIWNSITHICGRSASFDNFKKFAVTLLTLHKLHTVSGFILVQFYLTILLFIRQIHVGAWEDFCHSVTVEGTLA